MSNTLIGRAWTFITGDEYAWEQENRPLYLQRITMLLVVKQQTHTHTDLGEVEVGVHFCLRLEEEDAQQVGRNVRVRLVPSVPPQERQLRGLQNVRQ